MLIRRERPSSNAWSGRRTRLSRSCAGRPGPRRQRLALRCECGDAGCVACVSLTRAEYEAVRAYGSHFAVGVNHENPEDACVLSETAQFEVIDVIGGDSR